MLSASFCSIGRYFSFIFCVVFCSSGFRFMPSPSPILRYIRVINRLVIWAAGWKDETRHNTQHAEWKYWDNIKYQRHCFVIQLIIHFIKSYEHWKWIHPLTLLCRQPFDTGILLVRRRQFIISFGVFHVHTFYYVILNSFNSTFKLSLQLTSLMVLISIAYHSFQRRRREHLAPDTCYLASYQIGIHFRHFKTLILFAHTHTHSTFGWLYYY